MNLLAGFIQKHSEMVARAEALSAKDLAGTITTEESAELESLVKTGGEIDKLNAKIADQQRLAAHRRNAPAMPSQETTEEQAARGTVPAEAKDDRPFKSMGEFMSSVARAGMKSGHVDSRLSWQALDVKAASGASEAVGVDGGFLVQQDFSSELYRRAIDRATLANRVRHIPISPGSNGIRLPALKDNSRANGSRFGGISAAWVAEGGQKPASQMQFRIIDMRLHKLAGISYVTDELLQDGVALQAWLTMAFEDEFAFVIDDAIFEGTGNGMPLGFTKSAALVSVAKETSQVADTVVVENIVKMWARLYAPGRRDAVWLISQTVEPQLYTMKIGDMPIYLPNGTIAGQPYAMLLGRPVIPCEFCSQVGDKNDIVLFDPSSYVMIDKGGVQRDVSMHVRFIYDEQTFRFVLRVDGQPLWELPMTPFKGTDTLSPYVTLDDRA